MTMKPQQRYKLIDGDFTPEQATHVLLSLVKSKIDYHNVEKLSNELRFGRDVTQSQSRLSELRELRDTLRDLCRLMTESGTEVHINGWIEIQPVPSGSAQREPETAGQAAG